MTMIMREGKLCVSVKQDWLIWCEFDTVVPPMNVHRCCQEKVTIKSRRPFTGGLMETDLGMLEALKWEHIDVPSAKRDVRRPLHASVKCDTCTSDADVSLSSVTKEKKFVFVSTSTGGRKSHACQCVSLPCSCC